MIVLYVLSGIGVVAVGVAVTDIFGGRKPRRRVDGRAVDIAQSRTFSNGFADQRAAEYFPAPDDGRPQK